MEWTKEAIFKFLETIHNEPCLWDPLDPNHSTRHEVAESWIRIKKCLNFPCNVSELKKKKNSLFTSFRTHRRLSRKKLESGIAATEIEIPKWFAFPIMNKLFGIIYERKMNSIRRESFMELSSESSIDMKVVCNESSEIIQKPTIVKNHTTNDVSIISNSPSIYRQSAIDIKSEPDQSSPSSPVSSTQFSSHINSTVPSTSDPIISRKRRGSNINPLDPDVSQPSESADNLMHPTIKKMSQNQNECDIFGTFVGMYLKKFKPNDREDVMLDLHKTLINKSIQIRERENGV